MFPKMWEHDPMFPMFPMSPKNTLGIRSRNIVPENMFGEQEQEYTFLKSVLGYGNKNSVPKMCFGGQEKEHVFL